MMLMLFGWCNFHIQKEDLRFDADAEVASGQH